MTRVIDLVYDTSSGVRLVHAFDRPKTDTQRARISTALEKTVNELVSGERLLIVVERLPSSAG